MTGDNYNKRKRKSGQVLLITIMLIAVVLTVVLSITFTSRTETQLTKLEEENQKALAAAEAGIEAALKQGTVAIGTDILAGTGFTGSATTQPATGTSFVTPLIQSGQQYTFYLSDYSAGTFSNPYSGNVTIYYGKSDSECQSLALEISIISGAKGAETVTRYISDGGNLLGGDQTSAVDKYNGTANYFGENQTFKCQTSAIAAPPNSNLLIVRSLFGATKIAFAGSASFRSQGSYINSEARSPAGVTKKIRLFQSLPQIPADFFVTSF